MHYSINRRRCLIIAVLILILGVSSLVVGAEHGVITLTLDEPAASRPKTPAQSQPKDQPKDAAPTEQAKPEYDGVAQTGTAYPPSIAAPSAVLMDAATGEVLYSKNGHTKRQNASTTKIMTAILIIERLKMDDLITASKNASLTPFTSLHLKPGEKINVHDLMFGMLIRSANDAAVAAAEHIGGSTKAFSVLMNKKAKEIGCQDTHFVTPNGLFDPKHYTSAYDLCLITRYAFRYPLFNEAVSTRKYTLDSRTKNRQDLAVFAKSPFMKSYPGADGVKSGYIKQAGHCYVGSATRNGWRLVAAVLKSDNASRDTAALMDYGFNNFIPRTVARAHETIGKAKVQGGDAGTVAAAPAEDFKVPVLRTGASVNTKTVMNALKAPVNKGDKVGTLIAMVDGRDVASVELRATQDIGISLSRRLLPWFRTGGIVVVCLMVGQKIYGTAFAKNPRRRRRRVTASLRNTNRYR